jgi:hypothetical protein
MLGQREQYFPVLGYFSAGFEKKLLKFLEAF